MKNKILISMACLLAAMPFTGFAQQQNSGVVDYQVTMQRRGPNQGGGDNGGDNAPTVFTMNRTFTFTADAGKLASPAFEGRRRGNSKRGGNSFARRSNRGGGEEYVSFKDKKYIRAFKRGDSDTTFYTADDFRQATNFKSSGKTKKIAGYTCQQGTAQLRNSTYTIWFTKDIPVNYSPVNGLIPPDGGFVLGIQSDRMEYKATKVQLKQVADTAVQIPSPSHELSESEVKDMRKQMMDRMRRGRQNNSRQQQ